MRIRKAKKDDFEGILNVIKLSSVLNPKDKELTELSKYIKFALKQKNMLVLIVIDENKVVGVVISHLHSLMKEDADIYDLYVLPQYRNKGYGKRLMKELYLRLKKKGIKRLGLYSENNKQTLNFYRKQGFQIGRLIRRCDKELK